MAYRYKHLVNKSYHLLKIHFCDIESRHAPTSGSFKKAVMAHKQTLGEYLESVNETQIKRRQRDDRMDEIVDSILKVLLVIVIAGLIFSSFWG